jgi:hypothetical protein
LAKHGPGLYAVTRYVKEVFEVEVLTGESLSDKEICDQAINPAWVSVVRESVRHINPQPSGEHQHTAEEAGAK